jgi:hypothetical protein
MTDIPLLESIADRTVASALGDQHLVVTPDEHRLMKKALSDGVWEGHVEQAMRRVDCAGPLPPVMFRVQKIQSHVVTTDYLREVIDKLEWFRGFSMHAPAGTDDLIAKTQQMLDLTVEVTTQSVQRFERLQHD